MKEFLLKDGIIVDGNRNKPYQGSVLIRRGKIHSIITDQVDINDYENVIEVKGKIIAPGFIDIHSHSDSVDLPPEETQSKLFQGVTTEITGNCGNSSYPKSVNEGNIQEYLLRKTSDKMPINHGFLLGHGTLRSRVVGYDDRDASEEELERMCDYLDRALKGGAFGLSLGLIYPTGIFSNKEELVALAKVVKANDGILSVHMRSESEGIFEALDEMFYVAEHSGVHLNISHLKLIGKNQWNKADLLLDTIENARKKGLTITADQYPFDATSTGLSSLLPNYMHDGGHEKMLSRLNNDVDEKLLKSLNNTIERKGGPTCLRVVGTGDKMPKANGKNIFELSQMLDLSPEETVIELLKRCDGQVSMIFHTLNMDDVLEIMKDMRVSVGSDGSSLSFNKEVTKTSPHPRNFSTFPRFLQTIRENNLMPIEDAIYKATKLPVDILGLKDRGQIAEGLVADITVFDYDAIKDNSTYTDSVAKPSGIDHVFVGGVPEILDGEQKFELNGRLILK